ncbi:MAG: hypothetical protein ACWGQW_13155 [bacterium]
MRVGRLPKPICECISNFVESQTYGIIPSLLLNFLLVFASSAWILGQPAQPQNSSHALEQRLEEAGSIRVTRNKHIALTPDSQRLCVVRSILSTSDPRGELALTGVAGVGSSSPILRSFVAPMESNDSEQLSTGIAIMNLESEEVQLNISLRDEANQVLATALLDLPAMGHRALFLFQFDWTTEAGVTLDFSDFRGLLKVEATGKVAATVLQTRTGIFATQPVTPSLK